MLVERMTAQEAKDLLAFCLERGTVIPSKHFRDELAKETIDMNDAWFILRSGAIYDGPEQDIKTGEWKYRIEARVPDGQWIAIVFKFRTEDTAFLITVFSVEKMRR